MQNENSSMRVRVRMRMRMRNNAQEIQCRGKASYVRRLDDDAGSETVEV
jgi:hypothetical protein